MTDPPGTLEIRDSRPSSPRLVETNQSAEVKTIAR